MSFKQELDLSHARRIFAVGDIHGRFDRLEEKMFLVDFDKEQDHILSVGDLVDRGPQSHLAIEYAVQPWFHHVRGNHEQLCSLTANGRYCNHEANGGKWFMDMSPEEQKHHVKILWDDAPTIMEVLTPSGLHIGVVHACMPYDDWAGAEAAIEFQQDRCLWDRDQVKYPFPDGIKGIDHVFYGHNPLRQPMSRNNVHWIDTGAAYDDGFLTIAEIPNR